MNHISLIFPKERLQITKTTCTTESKIKRNKKITKNTLDFFTAISIICGTFGKFDAEYLSACRQIDIFQKHVISKISTINQRICSFSFDLGIIQALKKIMQHAKFNVAKQE